MLLKQSTARNLMVFMADSSDHITGKTGLTLTITASKDGAAFASISPTVTDRGSGWYNLALTTSHTDTLGDLAIHITGTGADATDISRQVVVQIPGEVMTANMIQIDGLATNGNNATLKLKSLDLRSNSSSVNSLHVQGYAESSSGSGGNAIYAVGGTAFGAGNNGGSGLWVEGGPGFTGANRGHSIRSVASGAGGGSGVSLEGKYGAPPINITVDGYTSIPSLAIGISGNVSGSVGSIASVRPKKNTGLDNFMFPMFDATTKNPKTGLTVTAERAIDGNPFSPCSSGAVELSNGVYRVSLSADDLNGNKVMLRFSATGADDQLIEIITQD